MLDAGDKFVTTDIQNNIVTLTTVAWEEHIVTKHPEMKDELSLVKKTIEEPDRIYLDKDFPEDTKNYFFEHKKESLSTYGSNIKVVVNTENFHMITTAYITDRNSEITNAIYTKPSNENE